ncbi:Trk K+ transport system, NAD-binding component [Natronorubrum sediminis]|uniref:Trk K+ transport system, NAD-binding component n=1 Tax=Natronorubrum sediminis TaxID=640943 RepID=A0A1H6FXQ5_9EURY|nr:NAD-binding protein [Natronorubrum sediminis]SEH15060.1 Trk K+ transport system, NAD-binding component [Natronorubrum sediminis]
MSLDRWPTEIVRRITKLSIGQRVALYVVIVAGIVSVYTGIYWYGMATYEDRSLSLAGALQTVVQSLTTTGYGQDAPWETTVMNLFTILMQFTGILLLFLLLPLFVVPWFRQFIKRRRIDTVEPLEDHVVISGHTPLVHTFIIEIESHGHQHPYVIIEADRDRAAELRDIGHTVLHGDPEAESDLRKASIEEAQAAVVAGDDQLTLNAALAVRDVAPTVPITATLEDATFREYLHSAGVEYVLQPRHVIGQALASRYAMRTGTPSDRIVILGHGTVGSTVRSALETWGATPSVVDIEAGEHVDIVGDATEKKTLQDAEIEKADAVIISLPEDRQAVLSTLLARDSHSTTNIFVRVTESEAVERVKRAGADYVLELPDIAGRLLAAAVLDEPISATEDDILITRMTDPTGELSAIENDRVVGVTRNNELHLAPEPDFELQQDDLLIYVRE